MTVELQWLFIPYQNFKAVQPSSKDGAAAVYLPRDIVSSYIHKMHIVICKCLQVYYNSAWCSVAKGQKPSACSW